MYQVISVLVDGVIYNAQCPSAELLTPCTCGVAAGDNVGTITCPAGTTLEEIHTAFHNVPRNSILGNVVLNFPAGTPTSIPHSFLGNPATNIKLIGPPVNSESPLSELKA